METSQLKKWPGEVPEVRRTDYYQRRESVALGVAYCLVAVLAGRAMPVFTDVYRGFGLWPSWQFSAFELVNLGTMVPIAFMVLTLLVWKDRSLRHHAASRVNIAAFGLLVSLVVFWFYTLFWIPPHRLVLASPLSAEAHSTLRTPASNSR